MKPIDDCYWRSVYKPFLRFILWWYGVVRMLRYPKAEFMGSEQEAVSDALDVVFKESNDFIVIGLTGRTGSGCSTTASLLSGEKLPLPGTGESHFKGNEARKYKIIKSYIDKKWQPFEWLQVGSVITRYILKLNFGEFVSLVSRITEVERERVVSELNCIREDYSRWHYRIINYLRMSEDSKKDIEDKKDESYEIYFKDLPSFSRQLRDTLSNISAGAYPLIYQTVGDNIRASGSADNGQFNPEKVFNFSSTINKIIKSVRHVSRKEQRKCLLVVDAIRNPYEAIFLKERYSHFYLVSVNTSNSNRIDHLRKNHKFTEEQIVRLDDKEYPSKLKGHKRYISQDIQKCIEMSDIHVNNPKENLFGTSELASQLAWYVALMMHPGLVMPTWIESCMQIAYSVKKNSGCISRQVGATVTDSDYSVKAVGWNSTPQGQVPCLLRSADDLLKGIDSDAYSHYEKNDENFRDELNGKFGKLIARSEEAGLNLSFCFKDLQNEIEGEKNQVHTRSLHAEENAFLQISKHGGQQLKGGVLFTTASPCELCAKKAYQLGIARIVFIDPYPGIATSHILSSGSGSPELSLFRGAVGSAFHKLYQPHMPFKDELDMYFSVPRKENKKDNQIRSLKNDKKALEQKVRELEERLGQKASGI